VIGRSGVTFNPGYRSLTEPPPGWRSGPFCDP